MPQPIPQQRPADPAPARPHDPDATRQGQLLRLLRPREQLAATAIERTSHELPGGARRAPGLACR